MVVYLIIVLAFCALYPLIPRKHIKWLFLALVLALSVMAFNMVPYKTDDVANYFRQIDQLRDGGWNALQEKIDNNENNWGSLPVCGYYFYFISLFPDNGMLPAITIFLAYGGMFLVLWRAANKFNVGKWYLFLSSLFILSTYWFYDICSGIRNGLAFTLFCVFIYFDVVEKKFRPACWIGYLLMLGLHSSAILMLTIRMALLLSRKGKGKIMSVLMFFAMLVGGAVIPKLGDITGIEYLQLISQKAERAADTTGVGSQTNYLVNISIFIVACILVIYCLYVLDKNHKYDDFKEYEKFVQLVLSFMIGAFFFGLTFIRFARWVIPAVTSVVFMVGMQANTDIKKEMYSNKKQKSVIKSGMLMSSNELLINVCFIAYTCVHLWYACTGSSLIWLHFS